MLAYEYLFPFFVSLGVSCLASVFFVWLSLKKRWAWRSRETSKQIPRLGGVALFFGFWAAVLADPNLRLTHDLWGLAVGSVFVLFMGFWDDIRKLHWSVQLTAQVLTAGIVYALGVRIAYVTNPFGGIFSFGTEHFFSVSLLLGVLWFVLLFNSINWLDGMDGLAGGVLCVAAAVLFAVSLRPEVYQPPVAILSLAFLGACSGFLIMNMRPAKIFLGTSGAFLGAFFIGYIAVFAGAKIATALLVLILPIFDAVRVIVYRIKSGKSLVRSDFNHLHHRLRSAGWTYRSILFLFYAIAIIAAVFAISFGAQWKLWFFAIVPIVFLVFAIRFVR